MDKISYNINIASDFFNSNIEYCSKNIDQIFPEKIDISKSHQKTQQISHIVDSIQDPRKSPESYKWITL